MSIQAKRKTPSSWSLSDLLRHIFTRQTSAYIFIFGRRESGKTDFSLRIANTLFKNSIFDLFASNIETFNPPFEIVHISDLQTLKLWSTNSSKRKLMIIDEVGKTFKARQWYKPVNIKMLEKLQVLRHSKMSLIFITPFREILDKGLLHPDLLDGYFDRFNKQHRDKATYFDIYNRSLPNFYFYNIAKTHIRYNPYGVSEFTEKPTIPGVIFQDKDIKTIYDWSKGRTCKDLGIHPQALNRIVRKFCLNRIEEMDSHDHKLASESITSKEL